MGESITSVQVAVFCFWVIRAASLFPGVKDVESALCAIVHLRDMRQAQRRGNGDEKMMMERNGGNGRRT